MKSIIALSLAIIMSSCNGTKSAKEKETSTKQTAETPIKSISLKSGCLPEGECSFEILKHTKMTLKEDTANMLYPEMTDDFTTSTIKFTYSEDPEKEMMDGHYREEIYFEVKNGTDMMNLKDLELANANFLYGRFCYCKGSAGYFKVKKGSLNMKDGNLSISFENGQVPQKLKTITAAYR